MLTIKTLKLKMNFPEDRNKDTEMIWTIELSFQNF